MIPVALHLRSQFSLLRSAWSVSGMVGAVAGAGYRAAALCDWLSLAGAVEFWQSCGQHEVKPILGCEWPLPFGSRTGTILLLVENETGYTSLCRLLTRRAKSGFAGLADLSGRVGGLVATTAGRDGLLYQLQEARKQDEARRFLRSLLEIFGPNHLRMQMFFHAPGDGVRASRLADMGSSLGVPSLAATEARYAHPDDARLLAALTSIGTLTLEGEEHPDKPVDPSGFHLRPALEWREKCAPWPDALAEAGRLAERCQLPFFLQ